MPTFYVHLLLGNNMGWKRMTLPEFFGDYQGFYKDSLIKKIKEDYPYKPPRHVLSDDLLTVTAAKQPEPMSISYTEAKYMAHKVKGYGAREAYITFDPDPLLKQGILNLGDKGINARSNADVESVIASFITGKKGSIEQQKKQLGSRRRKIRKGTRRRHMTRHR